VGVSAGAIIDAALVGAWIGTLALAWSGRGRRPWAAFVAGATLLAALAALGARLDGMAGGRRWSHPVTSAIGVALVMAGALVHARARARIGRAWGPGTTPSDQLVTTGPYAIVRHPVYVALAAMALGSALAHASPAVMAAAGGLVIGLAVKSRMEDRLLDERFGDRWRRWAAKVPAWIPRPFRSPGRPR
jgi:protein-S-isoprenylcysteine O-methyltransferase Ste14